MDAPNIGITVDIAGSVILLILIIVGAVKAWPYSKTDPEKFSAIYKPYKYWGFGLWILFNAIGFVLVMSA